MVIKTILIEGLSILLAYKVYTTTWTVLTKAHGLIKHEIKKPPDIDLDDIK